MIKRKGKNQDIIKYFLKENEKQLDELKEFGIKFDLNHLDDAYKLNLLLANESQVLLLLQTLIKTYGVNVTKFH